MLESTVPDWSFCVVRVSCYNAHCRIMNEKIREVQPHLKYFDYAATTPPHPDVIRTMAEIMETQFGNPSSIHGYGERAHQLLRRARSGCAVAIGVKPEEIVFTSGATESNNLAIKGAALRYQSRGRHIITTATEHASVYESVMQLQQWGWDVTLIPVNSAGVVNAQQVVDAIRPDTVLVSLMHVNNETGAIHPIAEIGKQLKKKAPACSPCGWCSGFWQNGGCACRLGCRSL